MPTLLTSTAFRIGYAVCCVLFGVFQIAFAHAIGHAARHVVLGLVWVMIGIFWTLSTLARKKARH